MSRFVNKIAQQLIGLYQKAEDLVDDMELPLSSTLINSFIHKYVTEKVTAIEDLHIEFFDGWLRLFATIRYKGIYSVLTTDLNLIQFQLDAQVQKMVFEQRSETRILETHFNHWYDQIGFNSAVWVCRHVLHFDPLGYALKRLGVVSLDYNLIHLDLNRYLADNYKVMSALKKVEINHAVLKDDQLVLRANVNLRNIFRLPPIQDDLFTE